MQVRTNGNYINDENRRYKVIMKYTFKPFYWFSDPVQDETRARRKMNVMFHKFKEQEQVHEHYRERADAYRRWLRDEQR